MPAFRCPKCKAVVSFDSSLAGTVVSCTECATKVRVPAASAGVKPAAPAVSKPAASRPDPDNGAKPKAAVRRPPPRTVDDDDHPKDEDTAPPAPPRKAVVKLEEPSPDDDDEPYPE